MVRIVFLDRQSVDATFRSPSVPHVWQDHDNTATTDVVERLRDATIAITNKVPISRAHVDQLPNLRAVMVAATGVDHVDLAATRTRDIVVANVRDYGSASVAEHVLMMTFVLRRNLLAYRESVTSGLWQKAPQFALRIHPIEDLEGSTLGVIGFGAIGRAVAERASALGMRVLIAERRDHVPRPGRTTFDEVLKQSDVVTVHVPLTADTRRLLGQSELRAMKKTAILINASRGGVVDELALRTALETRQIAGAAVDVLEREPPGADSPLLERQLTHLLVTPHVAWASARAMQRLADQVVENIEAFAAGSPIRVVTG